MPTSTDSSSTRAERPDPRARRRVDSAVAAAADVLAELLPAAGGTGAELRGAADRARHAGVAAAPADGPRIAVATLLAEALAGLPAGLQPMPRGLRLVERTAERANVDARTLAVEVAARALGHPRLLVLPPRLALEAVLELVLLLAPVEHVSLWRRADGASPDCIAYAGPGCPSRSARDAAARSLSGAAVGGPARGLLHVVPVAGDDAALVARPSRGARWRCPTFLSEAAIALRPALDRASQLERDLPGAELLANASERRVARIGYDLHDGPVQTLAALLWDARRLRGEVAETLAGDPRKAAVVGGIEEVNGRIVALEFELRTLCHSLESPTVLRQPFERVIEGEVVSFERLTGTRPGVELSGQFEQLTASQRIALLRVIQEALRNVREHASAHSVAVRARMRRGATEAVVVNDGPGFDVDAALTRAVREGRVGLIGMMERVRLLGGSCEVRSCAAGPTTVSVLLPRWRPPGEAARTAAQ